MQGPALLHNLVLLSMEGNKNRPQSAKSGAGGFVFDPPLPERSVVYLDGGVLLTVGPPPQ